MCVRAVAFAPLRPAGLSRRYQVDFGWLGRGRARHTMSTTTGSGSPSIRPKRGEKIEVCAPYLCVSAYLVTNERWARVHLWQGATLQPAGLPP
jgi:hypothetical protein